MQKGDGSRGCRNRRPPSLRPCSSTLIVPVCLVLLSCLAILLPGSSPAAPGPGSEFQAGDFASTTRGGRLVLRLPEQGDVELYKDSYALVIGNSDYRNGWAKLEGVQKDVIAVRDVLRTHGFRVGVVQNATRSQMEKVFNEFISRYGSNPENRLLFYFAGHGHSEKNDYSNELAGFLVPVDAPSPSADKIGFRKLALPMSQIEVYAKQIQSKHALFIFDACFAGTIFTSLRASPPASIQYQVSRPVRQFITSGAADEAVPDQSIFRKQFVAALEGQADLSRDGYVVGEELSMFLQSSVVNYSKSTQHPQYGKLPHPDLDKGDFVFELPLRANAPLPRPERKATVFLNALPPAAVKLNGRDISTSPIEDLQLKAGVYNVAFVGAGGSTLRKEITVGPDETVRCTAFFQEAEIRCRTSTQ